MEELDIDLGIDILGGFDPEKDQWNALIEAAMAGNVIPVIGPDIICDDTDGKNINERIVSMIARQLNLPGEYKTFSQLVYSPDFLPSLSRMVGQKSLTQNVIYSLVNNIFAKEANAAFFKPSSTLRRLLELRLFPFVITTSFTPVVEKLMREVWGRREVKVLSFNHNPAHDRKPGEGDIVWAGDLSVPTVYYMFGSVPGQPGSYVLTDTDMLEFCKSWLSEATRPENLCSQLADRYLLMLGCGYSDWLFRFIWFCMNKTSTSKTQGLMAHDENTHETLVEYLRRIATFLPENRTPSEIVDEIARRIREYREEKSLEWFGVPPKGTQVFISYSRTDSAVAQALYEYLTAAGLNVWYDRNNLLGGDKFMQEIEEAIETTKVFVPVFTSNIAREAMDSHVYRHEWNKAISMQQSMGSRNFIIPVNEEGFDFYAADIPRELKNHNSISFGADMDFSVLLDSINLALNKLDNFRSRQ